MAVAVFGTGVVACSDSESAEATEAAPGTDPEPTPAQTSAPTTTPQGTETPAPAETSPVTTGAADGATLHRVSLGFVSAYILARSSEAAVIDTGVAGSAPDIEAGLTAVGLGWDAVGDVILTHLHPDHIGSVDQVLGAAEAATGYAGKADIPAIRSPRPLTAVGDGDTVFGLDIIETPGHTPGHIAVLEPVAGVLVAGDALNGADGGGVAGPNPQFSTDHDVANESVRKLAMFQFETVVFGHGEPVEGGAAAQVAALADTLG